MFLTVLDASDELEEHTHTHMHTVHIVEPLSITTWVAELVVAVFQSMTEAGKGREANAAASLQVMLTGFGRWSWLKREAMSMWGWMGGGRRKS